MSGESSDSPVAPEPDPERLKMLAYAYLHLWRIAYLRGSVTLFVQGRDASIEGARDDYGWQAVGNYESPDFIERLREAAGD